MHFQFFISHKACSRPAGSNLVKWWCAYYRFYRPQQFGIGSDLTYLTSKIDFPHFPRFIQKVSQQCCRSLPRPRLTDYPTLLDLPSMLQVTGDPTVNSVLLLFERRLNSAFAGSGRLSQFPIPIGSMYGIYANIWGILMVNVTTYTIHGSYGIWICNGCFLARCLGSVFYDCDMSPFCRPFCSAERVPQRAGPANAWDVQMRFPDSPANRVNSTASQLFIVWRENIFWKAQVGPAHSISAAEKRN